MQSDRSGPCFQEDTKLYYGVETNSKGVVDIRIYSNKERADWWQSASPETGIQLLPVQDDHIDFINTFRFRD